MILAADLAEADVLPKLAIRHEGPAACLTDELIGVLLVIVLVLVEATGVHSRSYVRTARSRIERGPVLNEHAGNGILLVEGA